jgi:hypothetical protein
VSDKESASKESQVTDQDRIDQILKSGKIPSKTRSIVEDIKKSSAAFGSLTLSQSNLIQKLHQNLFPVRSSVIEKKPDPCKSCKDLGLVYVVLEDDVLVIAKCHCVVGDRQSWRVKQVFEGEYQTRSITFDIGSMSFEHQVELWREKMKISEEYWCQFEVQTTP